MNEWQPINTAPKANLWSSGPDAFVGPRIIVSDGEREAEVYWCEEMDMDDGEGGVQIIPEGWLDVNEAEHVTWSPTKWKSLTPSSSRAT